MEKYRSKSGVKKGMKRFVSRKRRTMLYKGIMGSYYNVRIENNQNIICNSSSSTFNFPNATPSSYLNFTTIFSESPSHQEFRTIYNYMRINAIKVELFPVQSVDYLRGVFALAAPSLYVAIYPSARSDSVGNRPKETDYSLFFPTGQEQSMSRYWKATKNEVIQTTPWGNFVRTIDDGTFGGQFSVTNNSPANTSNVNINVCGFRAIVYVSYSNTNY